MKYLYPGRMPRDTRPYFRIQTLIRWQGKELVEEIAWNPIIRYRDSGIP